MNRKFLLSLLLLVTIIVENSGQPIWSLKDCIKYALEHNIQVEQKKLTSEYADILVRESKYNLLPDVNSQYSHSISHAKQPNVLLTGWDGLISKTGSFSIGSNFYIYQGGKNIFHIKSSKYSALAALKGIDSEKRNVILKVISQYFSISILTESVSISENQLKVVTEQTERVKSLVDHGESVQNELLELMAQESREKNNIIRIKNDLEIKYLELFELLNIQVENLFKIQPIDSLPFFVTEIDPFDTVFNKAIGNFPEIAENEYIVRSLEFNLKSTKTQLYPSIYLNAALSSGYDARAVNPFDTNFASTDYKWHNQFKDNFNEQLSLNISIPLFNKFQVHTQVSKQSIELKKQRLTGQVLLQNIYHELKAMWLQSLSNYEQLKTSEQSFKYAKLSYEYNTEKHNLGIISALEYNISKNNYLNAELELVQSRYNYYFSIVLIKFYSGVLDINTLILK